MPGHQEHGMHGAYFVNSSFVPSVSLGYRASEEYPVELQPLRSGGGDGDGASVLPTSLVLASVRAP